MTFFTRSTTSINPSSDVEGEQQLHIELAEAVEETMVSTRSQDHSLASNDMQGPSANGSTPASSKKRKAEGSLDITPSKSTAKRRRKEFVIGTTAIFEDAANSKTTTLSSQFAPLDPTADEAHVDEVFEPSALKSDKTVPTSLPPSTEASSTITVAVPENPPTPNGVSKPSKEGKPTKEWERPGSPAPTDDTPATAPFPKPLKATHKRFRPEDLNPSNLATPSTNPQDNLTATPEIMDTEAEDDVSSSDEAPETVSAAAGLTQARIAVAEAAKVAKGQQEAKKIKRKELDAKLKEQAKSSKKHKRDLLIPDSPETKFDTTDDPPITTKIPTFLPPSILAGPAPAHLPTPPLPSSDLPLPKSANNKLKLLNTQSKPPKDLKRGPVIVRVLERESGVLPPKAVEGSRAIREAWLLGRRGKGGVSRKKVRAGAGSFLRKA